MISSSYRNILALGAALLLLGGLGLGWLFLARPGPTPPPVVDPQDDAPYHLPPDPRLAYSGPYENIHPRVRYLGDAACADCHVDLARDYRGHAMGQALAPIGERLNTPPLDPAHPATFLALGSRFEVRREGDRVWHRRVRLDAEGKPIYEVDLEVHYAIGSGTHGMSYLSLRNGYLFQSPISWYEQKKLWDGSPGFEGMPPGGRPVHGSCLYCHSNRAHYLDGTMNRYEDPIFSGHSIGCERCHGPGERHVEARKASAFATGPFDSTIVNPKHLSPELREAICQQCHLEGEERIVRRGRGLYDFRPGLPLESVLTTLIHAEQEGVDHKAVNHVEQMVQSSCYQGGSATHRLGCTSCHDPHRRIPLANQGEFYRSRCLQCHQQRGCTAPAATRSARQDQCSQCHMPRYGSSDVSHTASTDHSIPRNPARMRQHPSGKPFWSGVPVQPFPRAGLSPRDPEIRRDLGVGITLMCLTGKLPPPLHADRAVALLDDAVREDPTDLPALVARGQALMLIDKRAAALAAFETALTKDPDREDALSGAALLAEGFGQTEAAREAWKRLARVSPWRAEPHGHLASLAAKAGDWDQGVRHATACIAADPESVQGRRLRIACLLKLGRKPEADAEFRSIVALRPPDLAELQAWYAELIR